MAIPLRFPLTTCAQEEPALIPSLYSLTLTVFIDLIFPLDSADFSALFPRRSRMR